MYDKESPPDLTPPLVITTKQRIQASLVYIVAVTIAGVPASMTELVGVQAVVATAVVGAAIVYITWSVKTPATDQALSKQDLANLLVYMRRNPAHTKALMDYLMASRIQPWELTYLDARVIIEKANKIGV